MEEREFLPEIEDLNPTFLFTWKGTRQQSEERYHSHDYLEMAFVMSGSGKYHIDDVIYDVKEGDFLIFNPGVKHQALMDEASDVPTTEFFVGCTDFQLKGFEKNVMPLEDGGHILHTTGDLRQKLFKICSSMDAEKELGGYARYFVMKAYLMQLLVYIIRSQRPKPVMVSGGYSFDPVNKKYVVEQIVNYFEEHYSEKISLDSIAENMYLSTFYISKIFKSETGDAPIRHLINIRLEKAKEIIEQIPGLSIKEVAAKVGYEDVYHFSKQFKKHYGVSPSQVKVAKV
ncbi:MAG: helix-turn-helix domain-containing protein [Lachnospiraceae bacterium]|nr:helix-turn-helix domain-containing protein [Lachnospiraceae bacterium]